MSWLQKLLPSIVRSDSVRKKAVPEGVWTKCDACNTVLYRAELERNTNVCPHCNHHHRLETRARLHSFLDETQTE